MIHLTIEDEVLIGSIAVDYALKGLKKATPALKIICYHCKKAENSPAAELIENFLILSTKQILLST